MDAGLAEPEVRIDGGFFVLMIRRKLTEAEDQSGTQITAPVTAPVTPPVTPPVGEFVIQHSRIRGNKKRIRKKQLLLVGI